MPPKPSKPKQAQDVRLLHTIQILKKLKMSKPVWEELLRASQKYSQQLEATSEAARQFNAAMKTAASCASVISSKDVAQEIFNICDIHEREESNRTFLKQTLNDGFIIPIRRSLDGESDQYKNWEKNYQAHFKNINLEMKKAEESSKSAGKKSAAALQQAILDLTTRVKEMETARQSKLRELLLIEREKYCTLLMHYLSLVKVESKMHKDTYESLDRGVSNWSALAASKDRLPPESEHLIVSKERTFVGLKVEGGPSSGGATSGVGASSNSGGYGGGYNAAPAVNSGYPAATGGGGGYNTQSIYGNDEEVWDEEWDEDTYDVQPSQPQYADAGYNSNAGGAGYPGFSGIPAPPAPPSTNPASYSHQPAPGPKHGHASSYGTRRVRALYDNIADDAQELSFRAGDIIEVSKEVNTEWWAGFCNGRQGIFPANYVEPA